MAADEEVVITEAEKSFHVGVGSFEELLPILRDYEIEHTVRFTCHRGYKTFNAGVGGLILIMLASLLPGDTKRLIWIYWNTLLSDFLI